MQHTLIPTIAVGGSYKQADFYPHFPYVATDNMALVEMKALSHLQEKGLSQFAFYGLQVNTHRLLVYRTKRCFCKVDGENHYPIYLYEGVCRFMLKIGWKSNKS